MSFDVEEARKICESLKQPYAFADPLVAFAQGARTLLPQAIDEIERLRTENQRLRKALEAQRVFWPEFRIMMIGRCSICKSEIPSASEIYCHECAQRLAEEALQGEGK